MGKNQRMAEYNRGREQGLAMAARLLREHGKDDCVEIIHEEMRIRGRMPVKMGVTSKEIEAATTQIRWTIYESFMCMALMVLHDQFGFGRIRAQRFLDRWNYKVECMDAKLVDWQDMVDTVKEEIGIAVPTACMREGKLL